ncbi:MAG: hypothetical protein H7281_12255 [Bacteriovorax sp.]|nr:hypothetical protein [Bacteriovorax sp.]
MKLFSRDFLYTAFFFLLPLLYFLSLPVSTSDLAIWTALGVQGIKTGSIPIYDTFSILPTSKMIYPSWGISWLYGLIYLNSGKWGISFLSLFHKSVLFLYLFLIYRRYILKIPNRWHSKNLVLILIFFLGSSFIYVDRPALVAILPFLFAFTLIDQNTQLSIKNILKLVGITILWINIHASALLVILMLAWKIISSVIVEKWTGKKSLDYKSFSVAIAATCAALTFNPFGFQIFSYALQTATISNLRKFDEWLSPFHFNDIFHSSLYFLWLLFFLYIFFKEIKNRNYRLFISPYFFLTMMGLLSIRDIVWTFFLIVPMMMVNEPKNYFPKVQSSFFNLVVAALLFCLCACLNPFYRPDFIGNLNPARYSLKELLPEEEIQIILKSGVKKPIMNDLQTGGYISLRLPNKIFIDARNIIFSDDAFRELHTVFSVGNDWKKILNKYQFGFILLVKSNDSKKIIIEIEKSLEWKVVSSRVNYFLAERI